MKTTSIDSFEKFLSIIQTIGGKPYRTPKENEDCENYLYNNLQTFTASQLKEILAHNKLFSIEQVVNQQTLQRIVHAIENNVVEDENLVYLVAKQNNPVAKEVVKEYLTRLHEVHGEVQIVKLMKHAEVWNHIGSSLQGVTVSHDFCANYILSNPNNPVSFGQDIHKTVYWLNKMSGKEAQEFLTQHPEIWSRIIKESSQLQSKGDLQDDIKTVLAQHAFIYYLQEPSQGRFQQLFQQFGEHFFKEFCLHQDINQYFQQRVELPYNKTQRKDGLVKNIVKESIELNNFQCFMLFAELHPCQQPLIAQLLQDHEQLCKQPLVNKINSMDFIKDPMEYAFRQNYHNFFHNLCACPQILQGNDEKIFASFLMSYLMQCTQEPSPWLIHGLKLIPETSLEVYTQAYETVRQSLETHHNLSLIDSALLEKKLSLGSIKKAKHKL